MPGSDDSLGASRAGAQHAEQLAQWRSSRPPGGRWLGWRLRALVLLALLGCLTLFLLLRGLAQVPHLDAQWRIDSAMRLELVASGQAALKPMVGQRLLSLGTVQAAPGATAPEPRPDLPASAEWLSPSPRWATTDSVREKRIAMQAELAQRVRAGDGVMLHFDGGAVRVPSTARGTRGLGAMFWLLSALALSLYLIGCAVALARPVPTNLLYALMTGAQAGNLLLMAVEALPGLGLPTGFALWDFRLRTAFDVITAAAIMQVGLIHPRRLPGAAWQIGLAWALAAGGLTLSALGALTHTWWWTQALLIGFGLWVLAALTRSQQQQPHASASVLRRLAALATGTLALLTLAIAFTGGEAANAHRVADIGSVIWYVFFASLLLLAPFLSRSQHVMREFAMLAGVSTVATSLDLLFVSVFALGQFASLTLALFVAIGLYAGARQWLMTQLSTHNVLTAERSFESLYRAARAIETAPRQAVDHVARLMQELFDPLEVLRDARPTPQSLVVAQGAMLVVPLDWLHLEASNDGTAPDGTPTLVLRHAARGRRLFSADDARLANGVLEQLRRAVAHDRAVEQGRSEERTRLAQDLHDDIGARLLTLMYKAPDPEMEEYVRHTLQDLKTLTRGLAAAQHPLTHAVAEWKADITQRLAASQVELEWSFEVDEELPLTVVQWSGLTRILRELVNNVIAHAAASRVQITGHCRAGHLQFTVADDGQGTQPEGWSHGLGLGGVRKRVKLLGGRVQWRARSPRGIACEVQVAGLGQSAN